MISHLCPAYDFLRLLSGKWKPAVLFHLRDKTLRFGELRRLIPEVSQKMLTAQLKELEEDNVIIRTVTPTIPPRVDYTLSPLGCALIPLLQEIHNFVLSRPDLFSADYQNKSHIDNV